MQGNRKIRKLSASVFSLLLIALLAFYFVSTVGADNTATEDTKNDAAETQTEAQDDAQNSDAEGDEAEDGESDEKAPIPVQATTVEKGAVAAYISSTANLVPESEVKVIAEWEGRLASLKADEGDRVTEGELLAAINPEDSRIALEKAQVRASTAQMAYDRSSRLKEQELISSEEFDKVALDNKLAQQELAEAEWRYSKTLIRAPFDGVITERIVQPGQHIRPGDELFVISDFTPLIARIYLPEKDVLHLEEGRPVRIALKADESISFDGAIQQVSPIVDTATGTVKVTVEATAPPSVVRPGAFVRVDVVRETRDAAVLLPREAIVRELQKSYVYVAEDGVVGKRRVTLGLEENGMVEITDGVAAGEQVVVAGQGGLKDGAAVKLMS